MQRSIVLSLAILILGSTAAAALESHPRVDRRQDRQDWRIQHGIDEGSLTRKEAKKLHREAKQIRRLEEMALQDGHCHPAEVDMLLDALDELSDRIYRAKHNDRFYGYNDSSYREKGWRKSSPRERDVPYHRGPRKLVRK